MAEENFLFFWGVRGTVPVSGRDRVKYDGHTPCASLNLTGKEIVVVDAGTGIKKLGDWLQSERRGELLYIHLLLTHFHLDHIQGLPFFGPLYDGKVVIHIYADASAEETKKYLSGLMGGPYFPAALEDTESQKLFKKIPQGVFDAGGFRISTCPLIHPQGSIAYKIESKKKSIVFATDTEHPEHGVDQRLAAFASGADILVYDATYTPSEYEQGRKGWGHSTWFEGIKLAKKAGVGKLILSHFNPNHSDDQIDEFLSLAHKKFPETYAAMVTNG